MRNPTTVLAALAAICTGTIASAVTEYKPEAKPFLFDITTFTTTIELPVKEEIEKVTIPRRKLVERMEKSPQDKTVEPLNVMIGPEDEQLVSLASRIAKVGKEEDLIKYLREAYKNADFVKDGSPNKSVDITKEGFAFVNPDAFVDLYAKPHRKLTIDFEALRDKPRMRRKLMKQIRGYFTDEEYNTIQKQVRSGKTAKVDDLLLPDFARKMAGKYIVYRGPNCFHSALAFQSTTLTSSSLFNVKEETEYHRAMINYDELWRTLNRNFYEINPDTTPLKYGDTLVFFDVPPEFKDTGVVNFKWIRHASTYLFNHYTFSKGSKSPNSPYIVSTLAEEWRTWKRFTKNLGVKVFRRTQNHVKKRPPRDLVDWIY